MTTLVERHLTPLAREALSHSPALVIEGARQVGKSTLASQLLPHDAPRLSLDRESVRDAARRDPEAFVSQPGPLLIDEIQHAPELTLAVKAEIDRDRRPGRFILTGSASLLRVRGLADSLAGRARRLTLYGFSQGELAGSTDDFIGALAKGASNPASFSSDRTRSDYVKLCTTGGYPEAQTLPPRLRARWFDDYAEGILGRDLGELRRQVQPDRAKALFRYLSTRQSTELVKARAASDIGVAATTAESYLDLFRDVHLYQPIPPWTPNLTKREVGRPKILVNDAGLAARMAGTPFAQLESLLYPEAFGGLLEGFVAGELIRQQPWSEQEYRVFHFRDRTGLEVDLVIECDDGRVFGIEVKASSSYQSRQFSGLLALQQVLGDRFSGGIVLTTAQSGYRYAPGLWGLPVAALWQFGR